MTAKNGMGAAPGRKIPAPADFPVEWEKPNDDRRYWTYPKIFFPYAIKPLVFDMLRVFERGLNTAAKAYEFPIRFADRYINGYYYQSIEPVGAPPEPVLKLMHHLKKVVPGMVQTLENKAVGAAADKYIACLTPVIDTLDDQWAGKALPEVEKMLADWRAFDLENCTTAELVPHLDTTIERMGRIGDIHFLITLPGLVAMSQFEELIVELFGESETFKAYTMMRGFDNKILESDRAQWELGRKVRTMPAVAKIFRENDAERVIPALKNKADGQVFLAALNEFLDLYGRRGDVFGSAFERAWIDDPTPVIITLQQYIDQPDRDFEAELAAETEARERAVEEARGRLAGYSQALKAEFERLLKAAQAANRIHSNHGYWLDQAAPYEVQRVLRAAGRRLAAAGALEREGEVFYLRIDELQALLKEALRGPLFSQREKIGQRRAAFERFSAVEPPAALGTMPLTAPPNDLLGRSIGRYFGFMPGINEERKPKTASVKGQVGSPGKVRGPARIVRNLAESSHLRPGDILITETTSPPWTPLFAIASAVVTDTGGILCHASVVAREYGIPAVVGTREATTVFKNGELVEVDGQTGRVHAVAG